MTERLDAWMTALIFAALMLALWSLGWLLGRRAPVETGHDPGTKFTDASMALLGLLLAFTFSMALGRHDLRRLAAVAESNAIGDFYTCASVLKEPTRSRLQKAVHEYAKLVFEMIHAPESREAREAEIRRCLEMQSLMTDIVAEAIAENPAMTVPLTTSLNNLTSSNASSLAANQAKLPWIIVVLLLLGSVVPAFLMGVQQGGSRTTNLSGTISFFVLVTLVILVTLDLNQPARGFITVNHESLEQQIRSMAK
jgi:hypothetical protein